MGGLIESGDAGGVCTDFENRGVVKARITSTKPEVAGSIPAVGESRRSSVAEHWTQKRAVPRIPPQKFAAWRRRELLRISGCGFESRRRRKRL